MRIAFSPWKTEWQGRRNQGRSIYVFPPDLCWNRSVTGDLGRGQDFVVSVQRISIANVLFSVAEIMKYLTRDWYSQFETISDLFTRSLKSPQNRSTVCVYVCICGVNTIFFVVYHVMEIKQSLYTFVSHPRIIADTSTRFPVVLKQWSRCRLAKLLTCERKNKLTFANLSNSSEQRNISILIGIYNLYMELSKYMYEVN